MSGKRVLFVIVVASLVVLAVGAGPRVAYTARALFPDQEPGLEGATIPYAGRLTDGSGQPVADGAYGFVFALYEAETGGEALWSEVQEGVAVRDGAFATSLAAANPMPASVLAAGVDRALWVEVAVRGPGEATFTALAPRQRVDSVAAAPAAGASNGGACPHDHWGGEWSGNGQGLYLNSAGDKGLFARGYPAIYAESGLSQLPPPTGANIGVYGYAADTGLYGWGTNFGVGGASTDGVGVKGISTSKDGVIGETAGDGKSGVYGVNTGNGNGMTGRSAFGCGVQADGQDVLCGDLRLGGSTGTIVANGASNADLWMRANNHVQLTLDADNNDWPAAFIVMDSTNSSVFEVIEDGSMNVFGLATFFGGKSGYVVDIAQNDDTVSLERGDLVAISGAGPAVVGRIPVIKVRRATAAEAGAVIGIVDEHYVAGAAAPGSAGAPDGSSLEDTPAAPGEYLTVVTLGSYEAIKVDASYGAIQPGDRLVASPNPGYAMRAADPEPGTIVGKALGAVDSLEGTGVIPVVVTLD